MTTPTIWRVPVASIKEWVGPLTAAAFGEPAEIQAVTFLPYGQPITDDDWEPPVLDPDGLVDGLGVICAEQSSHLLTLGKWFAIAAQLNLGQSKPAVQDVGIVIGT